MILFLHYYVIVMKDINDFILMLSNRQTGNTKDRYQKYLHILSFLDRIKRKTKGADFFGQSNK
jgi:hypothetical protein